MRSIPTLIALFLSHSLLSQQLIEGQIVDQQNIPVPYVNVGIPGTPVGTCSYEDGKFKLYTPDSMLNSPITFSAIGYIKKQVKIDTARQPNLIIKLSESTKILDEVRVTAKSQSKIESFGPTSVGMTKRGLSISSADGGSAMATKIRLPDKAIILKKVNLYIYKNPLDSFTLRCRIQKVTLANQPGEDLLNQNVLTTSKIDKGWISVDLSAFNLILEEDFFLVFEWIMDRAGAEKVRANEANPLDWEKPNSTIWNSKIMTYTNEQGEYIKQKLTEAQIEEWKARQFPRTFIGFKKKNGKSSVSYTREQSMANWVEDKNYEMVANVSFLSL